MIVRSFHLPDDLVLRLHQLSEAKGLTADEFLFRLLDQVLPPLDAKKEEERKARALADLDALWAQDAAEDEPDDGYDLCAELDKHRPEGQKLFPPELKGISW
jgi:hypothetical protein